MVERSRIVKTLQNCLIFHAFFSCWYFLHEIKPKSEVIWKCHILQIFIWISLAFIRENFYVKICRKVSKLLWRSILSPLSCLRTSSWAWESVSARFSSIFSFIHMFLHSVRTGETCTNQRLLYYHCTANVAAEESINTLGDILCPVLKLLELQTFA